VEYRVQRAEEIDLPAGSVDLATAAIAVHWFDLDQFYAAVRRVLASRGVLAVWTYHLPLIAPAVDAALDRYYRQTLAPWWPARIRYVEERYRTLPFPFEELSPPAFAMAARWNLDQLAGFLNSWSATQRYRQEHGRHPLELVWAELAEGWGEPDEARDVVWPLYLRVGVRER
jgi:hypothetical protein